MFLELFWDIAIWSLHAVFASRLMLYSLRYKTYQKQYFLTWGSSLSLLEASKAFKKLFIASEFWNKLFFDIFNMSKTQNFRSKCCPPPPPQIALNETLSNAPSMSRNVPNTYPFLAILRSIVGAILCKAVSAEVPLLKPKCLLLRESVMSR